MQYDNNRRQAWADLGYRTDMGSAAVTLPPARGRIALYYMTSTSHALSNIAMRRIKVARYSEMNDPFELLALCVLDGEVRQRVLVHRATADAREGAVCLSEDWTSAVMWSHYADRHRGICLGFDVRRDSVREVSYEVERIRAEIGDDLDATEVSPDLARRLATTKCSEWSYEREWRYPVRVAAGNRDGPIFKPFDDTFRLREVILGAECTDNVSDVRSLVANHGSEAVTYRARLAWGHFTVVPDEASLR